MFSTSCCLLKLSNITYTVVRVLLIDSYLTFLCIMLICSPGTQNTDKDLIDAKIRNGNTTSNSSAQLIASHRTIPNKFKACIWIHTTTVRNSFGSWKLFFQKCFFRMEHLLPERGLFNGSIVCSTQSNWTWKAQNHILNQTWVLSNLLFPSSSCCKKGSASSHDISILKFIFNIYRIIPIFKTGLKH